MEVRINGEGRTLPEGTTVAQLLEQLQLKTERVAVEQNREIVKRERWPAQEIRPGDQLEIVQLVGGG
ncbi:MAG: sulfur carrier protein ThiS [Terriglobia bacterium]